MKAPINEAQTLILRALLYRKQVTANDGLNFHTTRISNEILKLRSLGLIVDNQWLKSSRGKTYVNYVLNLGAENIRKAKELYNLSAKKQGALQ